MGARFPLMRNNICREDLDLVIEHLKQDDPILTNGPICSRFEQEWSSWLGVKYSIFVNSGSSANQVSMTILKIRYPEGGEVIVPPLTWVSDIASVIQNGFTPVFVDIDPRTLAMNANAVLDKISDRTRAVFLTHCQGFDGLDDRLLTELTQKGIPLIEDVCESHGATHDGKKLGSFGWISNFSFYYAHHLSTIEGGMVCTNDWNVYQEARMLRAHGMVRESNDMAFREQWIRDNPDLNPDFIFAYPAYNFRNTEIGGILGSNQLKRLDDNIEKRTQNLSRFLGQINPQRFRTEFKMEGSSNYAFNLILQEPDLDFASRLMKVMKAEGIEFRRGSAGGGNQMRQPYLKNFISSGNFHLYPEVEHVHFFGFYLGNFPSLAEHEIDEICSILNSVQ